jgi:hypothetical protein
MRVEQPERPRKPSQLESHLMEAQQWKADREQADPYDDERTKAKSDQRQAK